MSAIFQNANLFEAVKWLVMLLLGLVAAYYRTNATLQDMVGNLITQAESAYGETKTGGVKFEWVCNKIYSMVPAPLRTIITRKMVENLVQSTFDAMAAYAKMQLDKLLNSTMPNIERTEDGPCLK